MTVTLKQSSTLYSDSVYSYEQCFLLFTLIWYSHIVHTSYIILSLTHSFCPPSPTHHTVYETPHNNIIVLLFVKIMAKSCSYIHKLWSFYGIPSWQNWQTQIYAQTCCKYMVKLTHMLQIYVYSVKKWMVNVTTMLWNLWQMVVKVTTVCHRFHYTAVMFTILFFLTVYMVKLPYNCQMRCRYMVKCVTDNIIWANTLKIYYGQTI